MKKRLKDYSAYFPLIVGITLTGVVIWMYLPVLEKLFYDLLNSEDYSFGLLMPFVMAYVIYLKLPQLRNTSFRSSGLGLIILIFGIVLYTFGELAADLYTTRISFLICIAGIITIVGGLKLLRFFAFPILVMLLMIPLPQLIIIKLTFPLRLLSSRLSALFLQVMGVPVYLHGNILDLGVRQLQVVDACSGLRYVLSIVALGAIYCYFSQRQIWKIAVLLAVTIPAAVFANALRLAAMGIYPILLAGFYHSFSGWLIFIFCLAILVLVNALLDYLSPPPAIPVADEMTTKVAEPSEVHGKIIGVYVIVALVMVISVSPFINWTSKATPVPLLQGFNNFPMEIGPWQGHRAYIDQTMIKETLVDAYLNAEFQNKGQPWINLWIAYYETQRKADGYIPSPSRCLPAAGYYTKEKKIINISPRLSVNYMLMEQQGQDILVYFWYLQRGRSFTSEYLQKLYIGYDGLTRQRTDGALIRLITPVVKNKEEAQNRLNSFAKDLLPILQQFIPD
jgi:exosortase D (VPLPA-CTERM-specific)